MKCINKKVLHIITQSCVGGAQSVVVNLANFQCCNNDVYVLSSSSQEAWKALDKRVNVIVINELQKCINIKDIIVLFKLIYWRIKLKPDIVHLHSSKMGMFGRLVFKTRNTLYTVHGFDSMRIANRKLLFIEKILKNACRFIVGVSQYDVVNLKKEGINRNITCIYNGVRDVSQDELSEQNRKIYSELKSFIQPYQRVIMCIARDDAPKRIDLFLELAEKMPNNAFIWIGNIKNYSTTSNIKLLGQVPMGYQLLSISDVFVLCSDFEGLPMSIIEALSFSKPVVSSRVGGVSEILDGHNGFAVNNNVDEFVDAINKICESEDVYFRYSQEARNTYNQKFTLEYMVNDYDDLYSRMLEKK